MTANEQRNEMDSRTKDGYGYINLEGLRVRVRVLDSRKAFGRDDVLITPADGSGQKWIDIRGLNKE